MKTLNSLFKDVKSAQPEIGLERSILRAIAFEESALARRRLVFSYLGLLGSFAALVYAGVTFVTAIFQSDFWYLISLAFSDAAVVTYHWHAFLLALLETTPIFPLLLVLVPTFTFFLSFSIYFSNAGKRHFSY